MKAGHTTTAALALCILAGGCAPTVWYRPGASQAEFGVDNARCRLLAEGANPDSGVETIRTGSFKRNLAANAAAGFLHGVAQGLAVRHTHELCKPTAMWRAHPALLQQRRQRPWFRRSMRDRPLRLRLRALQHRQRLSSTCRRPILTRA
jgi:hypothetical protein